MKADSGTGKIISDIFDKAFPLSAKKASVHIGVNALNGKKLYLPVKEMAQTSTYVLGSPGVGKTKFTEGIARDLINQGYGVIVLDGKGELYNNLTKYCVLKGLEDRTVLIDPNEDDYVVGINYLELLGRKEKTKASALAGLALEGLKKFHKEDEEYKAWLEEWGPASLIPLIDAGFTIVELFPFLKLKDPTFREVLIKELGSDFLKEKWGSLQDHKVFDQARFLNVLKTRASIFHYDDTLTAIYGQRKTTIDWLKVMDKGGIVLANLGVTGRVPEKTASFIGASIVHQIATIAPDRGTEGQKKPCFVIADEFQKFATTDFADAMERLRSFGVPFVVAHQHRDQFDREEGRIIGAVDACCRNKVIFSVKPSDGEEMYRQLFPYDPHWIKEVQRFRRFAPKTIWYEAASRTKSESYGRQSTESSGESEDERDHVTKHSGKALGSNYNVSESETREMRPHTEYEEFEEQINIYFSEAEQKEHYIDWLYWQDDRRAYWNFKAKTEKAVPIVTRTIKEATVTDRMIELFKKKVYQKYHRLKEEVLREINERLIKFIEEKRHLLLEEPQKTTVETKTAGPSTFREKKKPKKT